jgi:hypothetical protein
MNTRPAINAIRVGAAVLATLAAAVGFAAGPVAAATGPATSSVELGIVQPGTTTNTSSQFVATATGALSVTSPQPAIATVTSIQTYTVTTDYLDTSGDLLPGHRRPKPTLITVVDLDQTVLGEGPVVVTAGEKVVVHIQVAAPASTPDGGTTVDLAVNDAGAAAELPVHLTVGDVRASLPGWGIVSMKPGTTIVVPIVVHSLSGPTTGVTILADVLGNTYGLPDLDLGASGAAATVSHGDTTLYVTLTADHNLVDHAVLIRLVAFGTTTTVGDLFVHMLV